MGSSAVEASVLAKTWRQVLDSSTPRAFLGPKSKHKLLAFGEEGMVNPVLSVGLSVKGSALDVDVVVLGIEVDVADLGSLSSDRALDLYGFKERRNDKVDILAGVGEKTHHAHSNKGSHGATIIVTGKTSWGRGEELGDVEVAALGRQSRATSVVVLEDCQESGLVANVGDTLVVEEVKTAAELVGTTVQSNQLGLSMRDKATLLVSDIDISCIKANLQSIFPDTAFKSLGSTVLKGANALVVEVAAFQGVLVTPGLVEITGLEETDEASVGSVTKG